MRGDTTRTAAQRRASAAKDGYQGPASGQLAHVAACRPTTAGQPKLATRRGRLILLIQSNRETTASVA
jgi:hypothetical protein